MAVVPFNNPLAQKDEITVKELKRYPFIIYAENSGLRQTIDHILGEADLEPQVALEAVEDHTIIGFVQWGHGVALIPHLPQLDRQRIKLLHLKDGTSSHKIYCITKANHFLTPSISRFRDFAINFCRQNYINQNKLL